MVVVENDLKTKENGRYIPSPYVGEHNHA